MADVSSPPSRIDGEFAALGEKIRKTQAEHLWEHQGVQKRLEVFAKVLDELREIQRPRLGALAQRFGDRVKVAPRLTPSSREATAGFGGRWSSIR